ncbi:MAG: alkaline phosphatase D family protein [Cytophagales bacterium]|nr:alkaline phosphatase D family protein [Cytophagales bacterium]
MKNLFIILLLGFTTSCTRPAPLSRIAFGSCSNEEMSDQMWAEIIRQDPQLCILLGDNIYGDTHDMMSLRAQYEQQKSNPDYQRLLRHCPVIGTWDDHDYGQNDGGKFYTKRDESKAEFLRFMDIPATDPINQHAGVYSSHMYGTGAKQIKVILLDLRYFRDTVFKSSTPGRRYDPNPEGDTMGEEQWAWFENEIRNSDAAIHIIGSSIQLIANEHGYEKWGNFPKARQRMFDLISKHQVPRPIFISGDRHVAEISRIDVPGLPHALYDFTSSGLTHTWSGTWTEEPNSNRVGQMVVKKNFGMIVIDWSGKEPVIRLEIRGKDNTLWSEPVVIP